MTHKRAVPSQDTLVSKLFSCTNLENTAMPADAAQVVETIMEDGYASILHDFFSKDPLAKDVFDGRTTYVQQIVSIKAKYDGLVGLCRAPKKDEEFDAHTINALSSINHVGLLQMNPELFTTAGRRKAVHGVHKLAGVTSAVGFGVYSVVAYGLMSGYALTDLQRMSAIGITTLVGSALVVGATQLIKAKYFDQLLQYLDIAATQTDDFLLRLHTKSLPQN